LAVRKNYQTQVTKAIKALGPEKVQCLRNVFDELHGAPPQVNKAIYRSMHAEEMDTLDQLDYTERWIEHDRSHEFYRISPYALPLIKSKKSEVLIEIMEECFQNLKIMYPSKLKESATVEEICAKSRHEGSDLLDALHYIADINEVWSGKSHNFPYEEESTLVINERVLRKTSIFEIYTEHFAKDWRLSRNSQNLLVKNGRESSLWYRTTANIIKHPLISFIGGLAFFLTTSYAVAQAIIGLHDLFQSLF